MTPTSKLSAGKAVCTAVAGIATLAALVANLDLPPSKTFEVAAACVALYGIVAGCSALARRFPALVWISLTAVSGTAVLAEYALWYWFVAGRRAAEAFRMTAAGSGLPVLAAVLVAACIAYNARDYGRRIARPERTALFTCLLFVMNVGMGVAVLAAHAVS